MNQMNLREHIFAILIHGGILAVIAALVLVTSCQGKPTEAKPDPTKAFFKDIQHALDKVSADTITVIQINDSIEAGPDLRRQVFQEIQSCLHELKDISILEYSQSHLEQIFKDEKITPSEGISPDNAKELAEKLNAKALLYASIESKAPDVHFKIYSGETGQIIFAKTLSGWKLSIQKVPDLPILDLEKPASISEGNSSGTIKRHTK